MLALEYWNSVHVPATEILSTIVLFYLNFHTLLAYCLSYRVASIIQCCNTLSTLLCQITPFVLPLTRSWRLARTMDADEGQVTLVSKYLAPRYYIDRIRCWYVNCGTENANYVGNPEWSLWFQIQHPVLFEADAETNVHTKMARFVLDSTLLLLLCCSRLMQWLSPSYACYCVLTSQVSQPIQSHDVRHLS